MKVTVNKLQLIEGLKKLNVFKNEADLKLKNIQMKISDSCLEMSATDLNLTKIIKIKKNENTNIETGTFYINCAAIYNLLSKSKKIESNEVTFLVAENDNKISIIVGNYTYKSHIMIENEALKDTLINQYKTIESLSNSVEFENKDFKNSFNKLLTSLSTDDERNDVLKCFCFDFCLEGLNIVTSDAIRLTIINIPELKTSLNSIEFLLKNEKNIVKELLKSKNKISFEFSKKIVKITDGNTVYLVKIINKSYIPYKRFIPKDTNKNIIFKNNDLLDILENIEGLAKENSYTFYIRVINNRVDIIAKSRTGVVETELKTLNVNMNNETKFVTGFNLKFLKQFLKTNKKNDKIKVVFNHCEKQFEFINQSEKIKNSYILMPVRVRDGELERY